MKASYILFPLLASLRAIANPTPSPDDDSDIGAFGPVHVDGDQPISPVPSRAPDPPPAPTPLLGSVDGVLPDGSIINYTPNSASNQYHSCWTAPKSRPPPNAKYTNGTCSVCMVRRQGTDKSSDYQLWARDNDNNAMGNLYATTMWPIDAAESPSNNVGITMLLGGSNLLVQAELSTPPSSTVKLVWVLPPGDSKSPGVWQDNSLPNAMYDPATKGGFDCSESGSALDGAVRYVICFFDC